MRELKTKLLADISACEYLRPSLRARWYERLAEIGLTAADAESALTALSEEILDYRAEYPFDLTGLGQYGQAQILRSDLVGLSSVLVVLSAQCMNYQFNYCSQRERASGLDIPVVHRESHQASQGATLEPSSGVVSECVHCKRSTHLSEQSGRTWCGWCSTWASLS